MTYIGQLDEKVAGSSAPTPAPPAEPNALHNAVKRRDISLLSKIVRTMIDIDEKDANKQTALHLACSKVFFFFFSFLSFLFLLSNKKNTGF